MKINTKSLVAGVVSVVVFSTFGYGIAFGYGGSGGGWGGGTYVDNREHVESQSLEEATKYWNEQNSGKKENKSSDSKSKGDDKKGKVLGASTFKFTRGLGLGSKGDDVTELQNRLIAGGFLTGTTATGYFGKLTHAAMKKFQEKNGLDQVGNVGPKTRALLNN